MNKYIVSILLILYIFPFSINLSQAQNPVQKSNLRVLYVGGSGNRQMYPTTEEKQADIKRRIASFKSMLNDYFTSVNAIDANDYTRELSESYDVTIMDGMPGQVKSAEDNKRTSVLSEDFTRPILFIGETSYVLGAKIGLKFDWYCHCLAGDALSIRTNHPIFKGPFPVKITMVKKAVPDAARSVDYNEELPASIPMWTVQTESYEDGKGFRPGLISHGGGFEDSPDAEYISGGTSAKEINALAIGRHGSFFHWGVFSLPDFLTPEAKTVLANAIVYITKFDGKRVIARKYDGRIQTTTDIEKTRDMATERGVKVINMYNEKMAEFTKRMEAKTEKTVSNPAAKLPEPVTLESLLRSTQRSLFPKFGTNVKAYQDYYNSNMGYFYGKNGITIDEDLKALKIKHNDPRLLATAISMLEKGKDVDMARRILDRYTLATFDTPEQWRSWYEKNKGRFFFSESGGYYFLINSNEKDVEGNDYKKKQRKTAYNKIVTSATDDNNPVSVAVAAIPTETGCQEIVVKFTVHPGYHIYGFVSEKDPFIKTAVSITLPAGYKVVTPLNIPMATLFNANSTTVYTDEAIYTQEIAGKGSAEVLCNITYQCCNDDICFPPVVDAQYKIKI